LELQLSFISFPRMPHINLHTHILLLLSVV
jgi:hypothetical protein